jgi:hypothetical protein
MQFHIPLVWSLAASCALALAANTIAQDNCPMQTTQNVPANLTYGPSQSCGGIDYHIGELQVSTMRGSCPLFVIYTPPHQIAVPSPLRTFVDVVGQVPITKVTFRCDTRWFLILPVGSSCIADQHLNVGSVQQLVTRPCPPLT